MSALSGIVELLVFVGRIIGYFFAKKADEQERLRKLQESFKAIGLRDGGRPQLIKSKLDRQKERMMKILETSGKSD